MMEDFVRRNSSRQLNLEKQMTEMRDFYSSVKRFPERLTKHWNSM